MQGENGVGKFESVTIKIPVSSYHLGEWAMILVTLNNNKKSMP
jgi:hypothetical protein